jgi:hypothetical protein
MEGALMVEAPLRYPIAFLPVFAHERKRCCLGWARRRSHGCIPLLLAGGIGWVHNINTIITFVFTHYVIYGRNIFRTSSVSTYLISVPKDIM